MKFALSTVLVIFVSVFAKAADMFHPDSANQLKAPGIFAVTIPWIKDKGDKYDVKMVLHNENTEKGLIVFLTDLSCKRGNVTGMLKHTFFNTGEKVIDFKPNETKDFTLVCKTEGTQTGEFKLSLSKIYENPSLDGKTVGKVVAKDLTWEQSDRKK